MTEAERLASEDSQVLVLGPPVHDSSNRTRIAGAMAGLFYEPRKKEEEW